MSREKGDAAEQLAAEFLQSLGFSILARNYAIRGAEVDIIAQEGDFVAFVEVRSRKNICYATPRESVTLSKQRRIRMAALRWLQENGRGEAKVRFDIVEVLDGRAALIRAAFDAPA